MLDSNGYAISAATKHVFDVDALDADHFDLVAEVDGAERREMMHILDHGIGAFTLDASHLLAQSDADAKVALINFANCFGVVKGRGDGQSPVWRVQVREKAPALQSYSEMPGIAPFHTDASYYPVPMKYLLFFVIRPAEIGGETQIFNLGSKLSEFATFPGGQDCIQLLKKPDFPFAMSATFHKGDGPPPIEVAPVLASDHSVRFQIKALREGFRRRPDLASEEKVDAVERLNDFIQAHLTCEGVQLPRGHIVMLNNRRSLHSRKHFTDPQRLLWRIGVMD